MTPVISLAQANRYLLKRQHLLHPGQDPVQATIDACGLQAQVPSSPALSLRTRVADFTRQDYDRLLRQDRRLVRTWAMRSTVHVVAADSLPMYTRVYLDPTDLDERVDRALALLAIGPQTRAELAARAVAELGLTPQEAEREWFGPWGGVLRRLAHAALTVHSPADGADVRLVRTDHWLGASPRFPSRESLEDTLLMAYLRGYGPAAMRDFAHFIGTRVGYVQSIWARARSLAEVRVEGSTLPHFLPADDLPELLATTGDEPVPIHLLPRFDSVVLAYREKGRLLDAAWRSRVFRPSAVVEATVLIDGRVAGIWHATRTTRALRFVLTPFGRQPTDLVEAEARRLADWYERERLSFSVQEAE